MTVYVFMQKINCQRGFRLQKQRLCTENEQSPLIQIIAFHVYHVSFSCNFFGLLFVPVCFFCVLFFCVCSF